MRFQALLLVTTAIFFSFAPALQAQSSSTGDHSTIVIIEDVMQILPNTTENALTLIVVKRTNGQIIYTNSSPSPLGESINVAGANPGTYILEVTVQSADTDAHQVRIN